MSAPIRPYDPQSSFAKFMNERWSVETQGQCTEVRREVDVKRPRRGPIRKEITSFSRQSRMNLLRRILKTDWESCLPALFITLTFPDDLHSYTPEARTQLRESFQFRMEKHLGKKVGCLWRMEWVKRRSGKYKGKIVQHFHLIVSHVTFIHWWYIRKWWGECLGHHGILKTWVSRVDSPLKAAQYLCKYVSKAPSLDYRAYLREGRSIGRQWGILRPSLLPRCAKQGVLNLTCEDVEFLRSIGREKIKDFDEKCTGSFTMFGNEVTENLELWFGDRLDSVQPVV